MARQARHGIAIYTRELEPRVYDDAGFLAAVRDTAVNHPQFRLRVLVQDSERAVRYGHRLIELSRQFTTCIEVRRPHSDYRGHNEAFLVADGTGFIHRPLADRHEGTAGFHGPKRARELLDFFETVWERSEPDAEFRRLHL